MRHELITGATQASGKSNLVRLRSKDYLEDPDWVVVCGDPQPFSTAWIVFKMAVALGQLSRTIFDNLDDFERVIPFDWLIPSTAPNEWQRRQDDQRTVEMFLDPLARQRGLPHLLENPLIKEWAESWAYLMMLQDPRKPLYEGRWAYKPWHPRFHTLCNDCGSDDVAWKWRKLPKTVSVLERMINPAQRFLDPVFSPAVRMRDGVGQGFDLAAWLDNGGHYLVQGGKSLSKAEIKFLLASTVLRVIEGKRQGRIRRNVLLILEECEAFDLLGPFEDMALKTLLKHGLQFLIVCQNPSFLDD